jgi:hypothetical protein
VLKLGAIFWRRLKIKLCEAFKHSALFALCGKLLGALIKIVPRSAKGDETIRIVHLANFVYPADGSRLKFAMFAFEDYRMDSAVF